MRYDYDMLGSRIHQPAWRRASAGCSTSGRQAHLRLGQPRSSVPHRVRRPAPADRFFLRDGAVPELLVGRTVYGETQPEPR